MQEIHIRKEGKGKDVLILLFERSLCFILVAEDDHDLKAEEIMFFSFTLFSSREFK
jgi:hypothetical protein